VNVRVVATIAAPPRFDACVCALVWKLSFPPQRVPVFASYGI
jgi:hypothetical protein